MANAMITVDDQIAVRARNIRAIEVHGETVVVHCDCVGPFFLGTSDVSCARELRNCLLTAIQAATSEPASTINDADYGLPQISRIVDLLQQAFGERLDTTGFRDDLWLALQVIYGPDGAARFTTDYLNRPR
ncbi:hypothetical protein [Candidatus Erwinia dacicola]|uniref:Uncharacterized protein n=1 Tax=Candidatus Erwinia dacicola TaxID=252393 RepID=A0A2T6MV22_9GAMM|nr:hypothetical protein [Candidatus Erwinia dacicola]RAP70016.1 hypothetical protein ACZ87_03190 [Candidatus Erwinia dacicola]RAP70585.1 hypothetical protein ACZ87_02609 [Candidatus Erwinia dacicola]RAP71262.1 hypothetical protein ACZ87_01925 [Candidatus Erwinia dacicola]RAP71884.1 hypothetical protein ACZ87_01290 [Candidatus Erwinia dacicola]